MMLLLGLVACGDDGSPPPGDAAVDHDARADALSDAPAVCTMAGECPCFSNEDCPESTRCHAATEEMVYCEPGARGTGAAGTLCTGENDCASALCIDGANNTMRCTKTCTEDTECPTELPRCLAAIGICARAV